MPRPKNPGIQGFRRRVKWVVENLDPDPTYRRFLSEPSDVHVALNDAMKQALYQRQIGTTERSWQAALATDAVPKAYVDWLCVLFPDLDREHLLTANLSDFLEKGETIKERRAYWSRSIDFMSKNRKTVAERAKLFYRQVDSSADLRISGEPFPLITADQWIRRRPLELFEHSEQATLRDPSQGRRFTKRTLRGLLGDFVSYRGNRGYMTRRQIRPEPQHNGEIFCVEAVKFDSDGFTGFDYYLSLYFEYINTCEVLGVEFADWVMRHPSDEAVPELPYRGGPESAFDFTNRAAYPGVNCLAIFLNDSSGLNDSTSGVRKGNNFLLHKRDETQLQAQNSVHVVPAGGHQGFAKGARKEDTALWRTIVREFAEELFDKERLNNQLETWEDFNSISGVKAIMHGFFAGSDPAARVFLLGFGLDPVTLKPEVLVTIIIDWAKTAARLGAMRSKLKFNWELQTSKTGVTRHNWAGLSCDELVRQARGRVQSLGDVYLDTLPAGAACMLLTAQHYGDLPLPPM